MTRNILFLLLGFFALNLRAEKNCADCPALAFKENKNQWAKNVLYKTEMHNGSVFLCNNNLTFMLEDSADMAVYRLSHHPHIYDSHLSTTIHGHVFLATFENMNPGCKTLGGNKLNEYFNYYLGKDPSRWAPHVTAYYQVVYENIYNNIDLNVTSQNVNLKYDFVVKKGGSASDIVISYKGLDGIQLVNGKLVLKTSIGDVVDSRPYAYQVINGEKQEVNCLFELRDERVSFVFPNGYDKTRDLVIDPILIFSTYSGSTADNFGYSATYDSKGNAYAAGTVFYLGNTTYPTTPGAFQITWAGGVGIFGSNDTTTFDGSGTDVGITKYDSSGTTRIYSTYLGGNHDELPHSLIVNSNDELFVLGTTASNNFPVTHGAYDTVFKGGPDPGTFDGIGVHYATGCDMFITRFNADGTALLASTYLGGSENDGITYPEYQGLNFNYADEVRGEITIDNNDNVYIASATRSADFPVTPGAYQTTFGGGTDGVLVKMPNTLSSIIWSTFLGGSGEDAIYSIDFDPNGGIYVAGGTVSGNFPHTAGALQTVNRGGRADGFIAHFNQNGTALLQCTFYGSPEYDQVYFVRTDRLGNPYVFGQTEDTSGRFIFNALYNVPKSGQFISKLKPTLDSVLWSTVFGSGRGTPDISPTAFLVDVCNKTYISGWGSNFFKDYNIIGAPPLSTGGLYVTPNAIQTATDSQDFYVMVMSDSATAIDYATFMGSPSDEQHVDGGTSRFDKKGVIYQSVCAGCNGQSNFPTTAGAVSQVNNSPNCNNAVFKIDLQLPIVVASFSAPNTICIPDTLTFQNTSKTVISPTFYWSFGNGDTSSQMNPTYVYTVPGLYTIRLIVSDPGSCNFIDTLTRQILVFSTVGIDTIAPVTVCAAQIVQIGFLPSSDSAVTYNWTPANTLSQANVSNPFASTLQTTTYRLVVSNGLCNDTFYQDVVIFKDSLAIQGADLNCIGDSLHLFATIINSQPDQQLSYNWSPAGLIATGGNTANVLSFPTQSTTYGLTVTNQSGCVLSDSIRINVLSSTPDISVTANPDTITYGDSSQLNLILLSNVNNYQWTADSTLSATNILNPVATPKATHTYFVEAQTSPGCKKSDTITVYVLPAPCKVSNIYIPDAFSPNGDGKNDILYLRGNNLSNVYFAVYDRWGQRVFETQDATIGWDGAFKGKKMDAAVFGYYAKGECVTGEHFEKKGNVTLLR